MSLGRAFLRALLVVGLLATPMVAGAQDAPEPPTRLRVGVTGEAPFVVNDGTELSGISVEVWRDIAAGAALESDFVPIRDVPAGLEAVAHGDVDVLVGPISITAERAERVRFTQPYFHSTLGIVAPPGAGGASNRIAPFLTRAFAFGVAGLFGVLFLVGALVWAVERKKNPSQFPAAPVRGIGNGVWFALVTMTTVGYGDRAPVTLPGRIITGAWMIIAVVSASSLTAGIATALTLSRVDPIDLDSADKLAHRAVLAMPGTPGFAFAQRMRARVLETPSVDDGAARVAAGDAEAFVFDRPMLLHHLRLHPELDLVLARASYLPQGYGFALPLQTQHLHRLNVALLRSAESGRTQRITESWLGRGEDETR
jgi:polar amino acid transport system substrate-binding protein